MSKKRTTPTCVTRGKPGAPAWLLLALLLPPACSAATTDARDDGGGSSSGGSSSGGSSSGGGLDGSAGSDLDAAKHDGEAGSPVPDKLAAFAGAEGPGAQNVGGRGGRVIEVTNLAATGPGSLRAAIVASGPRIVVFKVSGIIDLAGNDIETTNPFITIAGQTAPEGGITVKGGRIVFYGATMHDFVVRYMKFRRGDNLVQGDSFNTSYGAHDGIVDHVSASWANDENMDSWGAGHDITWSWTMFSEGITNNGHSCGLLVGSDSDANAMSNYAAHHNLFAHNYNRSPLFKIKSGSIVNNVVYDWGSWGTGIDGGVRVDIVGNTYKAGPSSNRNKREISVTTSDYISSIGQVGNADYGPDGPASIYIAGNVGPHQTSATGPQWQMVRDNYGTNGVIDTKYQRLAPMPPYALPITVDTAATAEAMVLAGAGASQRIDENGKWVPNRDVVDARIVAEVKAGTGFIPASQADVGGYPIIPMATGYADDDHDGMANAWEIAHGFNPNDPADGNGDADGDGFTNVEEFLNGTVP